MTNLRSATIRLAQQRPEMRSVLLPLLKASEDEDEDDGEKEGKFERGEDVPLSKMPKKLQDNANNPPPEVQAVKDKIKAKNKKADQALFQATVKLARQNPKFRSLLLPVLKKHANSEIPTPPNPSNDKANAMGFDPGTTESSVSADYLVHNPGLGLGKESALLTRAMKLAGQNPQVGEKLLPSLREALTLPLLDGEIAKFAGDKWKKMPKGWTEDSRKKFWASLTSGAPKHKVTECMKKMDGKVANTGAFCGALADRVMGKEWRSEAAKDRAKKASEWLSLDEVRELCPSCADRMASYNLTSVKASTIRRAIKMAAGSKKKAKVAAHGPGRYPIPARVRRVAELWAAKLSASERKLAGDLAAKLKRNGLSSGMVKDFQKLRLKSMTMDLFLDMAQWKQPAIDKVIEPTIAMLEMGANALGKRAT